MGPSDTWEEASLSRGRKRDIELCVRMRKRGNYDRWMEMGEKIRGVRIRREGACEGTTRA
ncbi:hypothetical protein CCACVL1_08205 [Corchorus capsularis]|uniref:Uncharacterized protein n=1 Tax=Corchorus capsularis TaxID=210143 RepID=A0A1R3J1X3_COCAP|nr:hypothetical protein CCACVL1_08205 [Corchorus capsularis]